MRLVLLHALPFDGRMWDAERDILPGRTLTPTLYGLGDTVRAWAHGVLDVVDGEGGGGREPLVVVGCSVGGSCALEVARAAPDRVAAVVLVGAKAGVRPEPALRDEAVRVLTDDGVDTAWRRWWRPLFGRDAPAGTVAAAHRMARDQAVDDLVRGVKAFHDRADLTDVARRWRRPLVVVSGAEDRAPRPSTAARTAAAAGRSGRFHLVDGAGHYVNLERPAVLRRVVGDVVRRAARDHGGHGAPGT